ncbi:MAG: hypothetical protein Q9215_000743 [Flavoplaca cf. flavocitrina]
MATTGQDAGPSATERITQLSDVDRDVAELLRSAGMAIKTLTCAEPDADELENSQSNSIEERQQRFTTASSRYFSLLSSIDVRLRRHISALEDAGILPSETIATETQSSRDVSTTNTSMSNNLVLRPGASARDAITNGGIGNLDVGWLNSRNNNVERKMEANLWKEAHESIDTILEAKDSGNAALSEIATTSSEQP